MFDFKDMTKPPIQPFAIDVFYQEVPHGRDFIDSYAGFILEFENLVIKGREGGREGEARCLLISNSNGKPWFLLIRKVSFISMKLPITASSFCRRIEAVVEAVLAVDVVIRT